MSPRSIAWLSGGLLAALALVPLADRTRAARAHGGRLDALALLSESVLGRAGACGVQPGTVALAGSDLASWQSIGGCGAGASTGTSGGVKWIGRNVRGGLVHVECQLTYVELDYGYNFVGTSLVTYDILPRWSVGVSVPYLYKYMNDPYKLGVDLANKGPGDITLLATHRMGETQDWALTLLAGVPTGTYQTEYRREVLPQDRQLGLGRPPVSLVLDHTIDNLWGPIVVGGTANWRGGTNSLGSRRVPSGSLYGYASYLLGPFAPAIGVSATGFLGRDHDRYAEQPMPRASVAANVSLEWSTDWLAILLGASIPYDMAVSSELVPARNRIGAWTVALGFAFAPL